MPRPKTPLAVLEISGATRKNPQRYRARKAAAAARPSVPPIGPPPKDWVDAQEHNGRCRALLEIWEQFLLQDRIGLRVLNASHRLLLENACLLQYKIRRAAAGTGKATAGDWTTMKSYLAAMGMTPIDSSRVAEAVRVPERGAGSAPARNASWGELTG